MPKKKASKPERTLMCAFVLSDDGFWEQPNFWAPAGASDKEIENWLLTRCPGFYVCGIQPDPDCPKDVAKRAIVMPARRRNGKKVEQVVSVHMSVTCLKRDADAVRQELRQWFNQSDVALIQEDGEGLYVDRPRDIEEYMKETLCPEDEDDGE